MSTMSNCIRTENQARAAFQSASKRPDPKDRVEYYNSWAETYDKDHTLVSYSAPELAVNFLFEHYKGNPEEELVLDVACGTGLVAKRMNQLGFRHFVGVDGSKGMLDKANDTGLYQHLEHTLLGSEPLPAEPGKFDVVMIVGALRPGLVPISVIEELYKAAKPGAYICMSRVNPIPEDADEYKDKMEALLKLMEDQHLWSLVATQATDKYMKDPYHNCDKEVDEDHYLTGTLYLFKKHCSA